MFLLQLQARWQVAVRVLTPRLKRGGPLEKTPARRTKRPPARFKMVAATHKSRCPKWDAAMKMSKQMAQNTTTINNQIQRAAPPPDGWRAALPAVAFLLSVVCLASNCQVQSGTQRAAAAIAGQGLMAGRASQLVPGARLMQGARVVALDGNQGPRRWRESEDGERLVQAAGAALKLPNVVGAARARQHARRAREAAEWDDDHLKYVNYTSEQISRSGKWRAAAATAAASSNGVSQPLI